MSRHQPGAGLRVVNAATGLAAALIAKHFAELGATVVAVPPAGVDDTVAEQPAAVYWDSLVRRSTADELDIHLADADVCLVGGCDVPGATARPRAEEITAAHPRLVVLDLTDDASSGEAGRGIELLAQARTGLVFEQFSAEPYVHGHRPATYGAVLTSLVGIWAALVERVRSQRGQVVRTGPTHGIAALFAALGMTGGRPGGGLRAYPPLDVRQLIFRTADGGHVQLVLGIPGAVAALYALLEIPVDAPTAGRGVPTEHELSPSRYFADYELIAPYAARLTQAELLRRCWAAGLGAEAVRGAGECWSDEQVRLAGGLVEHDGATFVGSPITVQPIPTGAAPRGPSGDSAEKGPLAGTRVVDLGAFVSGPLAARILGDLGAEVIHVDPFEPAVSLTSQRQLVVVNRGKRSVSLDLKSAGGREAAQRLLDRADVVVHNFRVGVAERLGIDTARLVQSNPSVVALQVTAFGRTGPKARDTGFDMVVQAVTGIERRAGGPDGEPVWVRSTTVDYVTGILGAVAVLIGLYHRAVNGGAVDTHVDLLRSALFLTSDVRRDADGTVVEGLRLRPDRGGFHPAERLYRTTDGWLAVAALGEAMAQRLAAALRLDLGPRRTWATDAETAIAAALATLSTAEASRLLTEATVWHAPCLRDGMERTLGSAELRNCGLVVSVEDDVNGLVSGWFGALVDLDRSACLARPRQSAPRQGQHTREVLTELGYEPLQISALEAAQAIRSPS